VELQTDQIVDNVKRAIKKRKENDFKGLDADRLVLYQVSIPNTDGFEERVKSMDLEGMKYMSPVERLSQVFPSVASGHVHVIIRVPSLGKSIGSSHISLMI
jgi:hypothetical protein